MSLIMWPRIFFLVAGISLISLILTPSQNITSVQGQEVFEVTPAEVTLEANAFSAIFEINGIHNFDAAKIIINGCKNICTYTVAADGKVTVTLLDAYKESKKYSTEEISVSLNFEYPAGENEKNIKKDSVKIVIPARVKVTTLTVGNIAVSSETMTEIELIDGDNADVSVEYTQDGTSKTDFSLKPVKPLLVSVAGKNLTAKDVGETAVIVLAGEGEETKIGEFKVKVKPFIKTLEVAGTKSIFMPANSSIPLNLTLKDKQNRPITDLSKVGCVETNLRADLPQLLEVKQATTSFTISSKTLSGENADTRTVTCEVKEAEKRDGGAGPVSVAVTVQPKRGYMTIEALNGTTLLPNGALSFLVNVYNQGGTPQSGGIEYFLVDQNDKQWVSLMSQGSKLTINWVDLPNPEQPDATRPYAINVGVRATITGAADFPVENTITVRMGGNVTRFSSLKVKLNVMDGRTVRDLYGKVMADDYYTLMVRLFNDLKSEDKNANIGQSILAYSSSIEIAVGLEKQYDGSSESGIEIWNKDRAKAEKKEWSDRNESTIDAAMPSVRGDYRRKLRQFNDVMKEASRKHLIALEEETKLRTDRREETLKKAKKARAEADAAHRKATILREQLRSYYQDNLPPLEPFTYRPDVAINDGKWYPASRDDLIRIAEQEAYLSADDDDSSVSAKDNEPNCIDTITYRPYTFEMMVNTVDRREERTWRSRIFKILKAAAFGASTAIAVAVPPDGSDLPLGIEKFGNVLIPGIDELYPDLKEQHRQNIVSQAMKPIEEIPFGSDITRVIFVPKKSIRGLVTAHKARISLICPFYFKVKVAVITKGGDVTLGGQRTPN